MRGAARFGSLRRLVERSRGLWHTDRLPAYLRRCEARLSQTQFADVDRADFVRRLDTEGIAFGLKLPASSVQAIVDFAARQPCYADRDPAHGFLPEHRDRAEAALGKPILVAQYFNVASECPEVARLIQDPVLEWIAGAYLGSMPTFVGANLWWTFPVAASQADRDRHAHLFHRDVDDFRFFKFFFYLTDVEPGDGGHVCVVGSHRRPPMVRVGDRWNIRRYSDEEVARCFPAGQIMEIVGAAGTGFAENTLCVHKGMTPRHDPRLLLQLQFALFDYGAMHDRRGPDALRRIA